MSRIVLTGLDGTNPLGFFGALGLLRLLDRGATGASLGFLADGSFHPFVEAGRPTLATAGGPDDADRIALAALVAEDAARCVGDPAWDLRYEKRQKDGVKVVADLKAPPAIFEAFLGRCLTRRSEQDDEAAEYAAAFGTSVAVDGKGNTKPTAFHFTAANQQFLGTLETIRALVDQEWTGQSLFEGHAARPGPNLRWDPTSDRNYALMANDPNTAGTSVDAPLEWLAFRGLPLFPTFPFATRVITTSVSGRGDDMTFRWPLWTAPTTLRTVRSILPLAWDGGVGDRRMRGVFAVCSSAIRRSGQGFGNFAPPAVSP